MLLTERRKRFIDEYLIDRNAAQAAIRAGYSRRGARQTEHRLLTKVDIASEIQKRSKAIAEKLGVDHKMAVAGFMDAVEMAREKNDARTMLTAAKELAKICGFYPVRGARVEELTTEHSEPPKDVTIGVKLVQELSIEELEQIVGIERVMQPEARSLEAARRVAGQGDIGR